MKYAFRTGYCCLKGHDQPILELYMLNVACLVVDCVLCNKVVPVLKKELPELTILEM